MSERRYEKLAAEIAQELAIITTLTGKEARIIAEAAVKIATFDTQRAAVEAEALREAAVALDNCTDADVNNAIGQPSPTYSHSDRYADVRWLELRADQIEEAGK